MSEQEFRLPDVGEGLADAAIVRWMVPEGGALVRMESMVEIETAKSTVEIPSPIDGVLLRHGAGEGESLDVGAVLATIWDGADAPADAVPATGRSQVAVAPADAVPATGRSRVPAAPTVRRRATAAGVDLAVVAATGPGGRVLAADLEAHLRTLRDRPLGDGAPAGGADERIASDWADSSVPDPAADPLPGPAHAAAPGVDAREPVTPRILTPDPAGRGDWVEPLSNMRLGIATALQRAWSEVPLITDLRDVDALALTAARSALKAEHPGAPLTFTALFAYATLSALRAHPRLNASLDLASATVTYHGAVNLGIAVSVPDGLAVGVVRDADTMTLRTLGERIADIAERARSGRLTLGETTGATFTVSSYGQFGGWYGTPLVVPPQVAIAGFGPVKDAVVPVDGVPAVRPTLPLSVSADHRLIDGAALSAFCSHVERVIAEPIRMLAG
jgi:pyruvate/2-oxoglutarate dehydrogenase complex dihydrolipoamide acyltransferase (E2) component